MNTWDRKFYDLEFKAMNVEGERQRREVRSEEKEARPLERV